MAQAWHKSVAHRRLLSTTVCCTSNDIAKNFGGTLNSALHCPQECYQTQQRGSHLFGYFEKMFKLLKTLLHVWFPKNRLWNAEKLWRLLSSLGLCVGSLPAYNFWGYIIRSLSDCQYLNGRIRTKISIPQVQWKGGYSSPETFKNPSSASTSQLSEDTENKINSLCPQWG